MAKGNPRQCVGRACQYVIVDDKVTCESGGGTCSTAKLLEARPSSFHPEELIKATRKIEEILKSIPADPAGRKLSFLHTNFGSLLAWVDHKAVPSNKGVRPDADDATIAKALRLKNYKTAAAGAR